MTGHADMDFGFREMYKNPIPLTTLTGLMEMTEPSRMLHRKMMYSNAGKSNTMDDSGGFHEPCAGVDANSCGDASGDFDGLSCFHG